MILEKDADGNDHVLVRQSWWGTFTECNERGRLAIIDPDADGEGDAAAAGTAAHAAIEECINGTIAPSELKANAELHAHRLLDTLNIEFKSFDHWQDLVSWAGKCAEAWGRDIWPKRPKGGRTEVPFKVRDLTRVDGVRVGITGTIDLVLPNDLRDWKTSARRYDEKKYQKNAHQPTFYSIAAVEGGLDVPWQYTWPMPFTYGVMVRNVKPTCQQFTVVRTEAHAAWLMHRIEQAVRMMLTLGLEKEWPTNDTSFLCSDRWCPWWDGCKGKYLSWHDDKLNVG